MTEFELTSPSDDVIAAVERCAMNLGLNVTRGSLKKYPDSTHWHLTMPGQKGTLECTWWPSKDRLWLATHSNRTAEWQRDVIDSFSIEFSPKGCRQRL
jgi:hypothetical protein